MSGLLEMNTFALTKDILRASLQLGPRADLLEPDTPLMGHFPELNSLTVMGIISGIEEHLGCVIDDKEITAEIFETVGTLNTFITQKSNG